MIVASSTHVPNGFFNTNGGYELPATFGLVGSSLALMGPGRFSLDQATGHLFNRRWMAIVGLMSTIAGAAYMITTRRPPDPAPDEVTRQSRRRATKALQSRPPSRPKALRKAHRAVPCPARRPRKACSRSPAGGG